MNPLISIIVPCYNLQDKIEQCIKSLCNQTYNNLEIIVIDDGSKDDSLFAINTLSKEDKRIKCYSHKNRGVSYTRNFGISIATGEYVMFVDGDDYLSETYLEHMVNAISENTDLIIGGLTFRHQNYDIITKGFQFECNKQEFFKKFYVLCISKRLIFGPYNKLFRLKLLQNKNIKFREDIEIREDNIFNLDFIQYAEHICGITDPGYYYIQSEIGTSLIGKFHIDEYIINAYFFKRILELYQGNPQNPEIVEKVYHMFLNMDYTSIYKCFCASNLSAKEKYSYINTVIHNSDFKEARAILRKINFKKSIKYYRTAVILYIINELKVLRQIINRRFKCQNVE